MTFSMIVKNPPQSMAWSGVYDAFSTSVLLLLSEMSFLWNVTPTFGLFPLIFSTVQNTTKWSKVPELHPPCCLWCESDYSFQLWLWWQDRTAVSSRCTHLELQMSPVPLAAQLPLEELQIVQGYLLQFPHNPVKGQTAGRGWSHLSVEATFLWLYQ